MGRKRVVMERLVPLRAANRSLLLSTAGSAG